MNPKPMSKGKTAFSLQLTVSFVGCKLFSSCGDFRTLSAEIFCTQRQFMLRILGKGKTLHPLLLITLVMSNTNIQTHTRFGC